MIEKYFIKNELTKKRWRRFKNQRVSLVALWIFFVFIFISLTAEFWSNEKPIVFSYQGNIYWTVHWDYHPSEFGEEGFVTNYKKIYNEKKMDWAVWPPVTWSPFETNKNLSDYPSPPSRENLFGTDDRGRDILSRLIYGFRYSISYALAVWFLSYLIGTLLGALMGFLGGTVDIVGQRIVEIFETIPVLLILMTLVSIFGANFSVLVLVSVVFGWMMISVYMRAEFLKLRKREFVEAARALGVSRWGIILKQIMPNALGPLVTFSPFTIAGAISSLAILDYLGFGFPPPTPSWGELLSQAQKNFTIAWWLAVFPSIFLFISVLVLALIGQGVRDAFDPRKVKAKKN